MRTRPLTAFLCLAALAAAPAAAQTKLLRFPDVHGDRVVFTYAGDLWLAPAAGGAATRLTAHPGLELFAKFSPDGRSIAFTGQYDGDEQVYVVPAAGGVPEQLTFYPARGPLNPRWGYDNQVVNWTPDGTRRPLPLAARRLGPVRLAPLHGAGGRRARPAAADADLGRRRPRARRQAHRLHPERPRLPHLEALPGRLAAGPLALRPRQPRLAQAHRPPAQRQPPDVDRRHDLLQLRPHRHPQPLRPGPRRRRRAAAHPEPAVGRALAGVGQPGADRLRAERRAVGLRRRRAARARPIPIAVPTDGLYNRPVAGLGRRADRGRGALAQGRARGLRGARRRLHGADREGRDAQPDRHLRTRTTSGRAGRPTGGRSPTSPTRAARTRSGSATRTARARPSSSPAAARRCATPRTGRRTASASPSATRTASSGCSLSPTSRSSRSTTTRSATDPRPDLVVGRRAPRLQRQRRQRLPLDLDLERRRRQDAAGDRRGLRRGRAGLGPEGQLPLLLLRARLRAAVRQRRLQLRGRAQRGDLRPGAAPRRAAPVPARERRGDGREGGREEGRREEGRQGRRSRRLHQDRLRRSRRARRARAGAVRGLQRPLRRRGQARLHQAPRLLPRPRAGAGAGEAPGLQLRGPQGDDARREGRRLRHLGRRHEDPGLAGGTVEPLRDRQGQGQQEDALDLGPGGRPRAGRGVGGDLRRGLAPLPRLLLRREHARLRLGGARRGSTGRCSPTSATARTSTT